MFGFVAYQLWGTGIEYARAQDRLENDFEELLAELSTTSTSTGSSTAAPTTTSPPGSTTTVAGQPPASTTTPSTTAPTTPPNTSTIPDYGEIIAGMDITPGQAIGFLGIPRLDLGVYVVPGVGREDLKQGVGHFPQTPMPGQLGNAAIAGHRTTYGHPFLDLDQLELGDEIDVTMPYGVFVYRVTSIEIVEPSQTEVIATTDPTKATLTLATCHPAYTARQRLIIHAELDVAASTAPGQPLLNYGYDEPFGDGTFGLPGDEGESTATTTAEPTTTAAPTTVATTTVATTATTVAGAIPASTTTAPAASTTTVEPTVPSTTDEPLAAVGPGSLTGGIPGGDDVTEGNGEAFNNRWFSDDEAFPQVALWAGAVAAIAVAAYQLAKWRRNLLIGFALGVLPFVVGLYFFYENVNRLLPAAL
jgi:sortase A